MRKILMLLERDFPPDGRVEKEAISLIDLGYEVHIACFNFGKRAASENYKGIFLHRMKIHRQVFKKSSFLMNHLPLYQQLWKRHISKIIKEHQFYAIHVHDLPLCGLGQKFARKANAFYIADMHENYPFLLQEMELNRYWLARWIINVSKWKRLEFRWLKTADKIIVTCQEMQERLVSIGLERSNIYIVENTLRKADNIRLENMTDQGHFTLIYVGGINKHRGLHIAIEGYAMIRETYPHVRIWIVGDGKYLNTLKSMVTARHIEGVTFFGLKSRAETDELISRADVGIIPHKKSDHTDNTSPNKIFEYFQFGKPVIVSDCNYLVRVIKETRAGEVFDHSSAENFAKVFEAMLKADLEKYSENAKKAVEIDFYWEKTVLNLHALYQSLP